MISCGTMNLGSLKSSIDGSPFLLFLYHVSPQWDYVLQRKIKYRHFTVQTAQGVATF